MKKLFALTLALVLTLSLAVCGIGCSGNDSSSSAESSQTASTNDNTSSTPAASSSGDEIKVGGSLQYGDINWRVLAVQDGKALLVADDEIGARAWHDTDTEVNIPWADSDIRAYLNGEFFNSLPEDFKARVVEVENQNPGSDGYSTPGGDPMTTDKVFLLSVNEAKQYFAAEVLPVGTDHGHSWWLRSPGMDGGHAAGVGSATDIVYAGGYVVTSPGGVRPALWITLN